MLNYFVDGEPVTRAQLVEWLSADQQVSNPKVRPAVITQRIEYELSLLEHNCPMAGTTSALKSYGVSWVSSRGATGITKKHLTCVVNNAKSTSEVFTKPKSKVG